MTPTETKRRIQQAIEACATGDLSTNAMAFWAALGYRGEKMNYLPARDFDSFNEVFVQGNKRFDADKAFTGKWKSVDLLFQLTGDHLSGQDNLFRNERVDDTIIESYLFFAIELKAKGREQQWTRTDLSHITREVNKCFAMPAMILFKHEETLTLAIIDRRLHKRESSKDVLEKVTLIKDIRTADPHRAHVEILFDLSLEQLRKKHDVPNFPKLHEAWRKTLDTKELNKRFFRELSNWYFHAVELTEWPADTEPDRDKRNAINTIRLITRLMFVWFLKEKDLVPEDLFDTRKLDRMLKPDSGEESLYYKAILQNLFFATLNTEMGEKRRFRIEADRSQSKHYFIHNVFRYERCFKDPKATLKDVFAPIPFLNGGLFECLDKQVEVKGKLVPVRVDGFSDRKDNPLLVPDKLFFDPEGEEYDFSEVYGSKKARKEKVRGLIDILSSYKFTITENTPIEEEVALDPELLGKVFENLLANYNPETKTTARKQTGSFYTPREIVNYMVDESLIAYLRSFLESSAPSTHVSAEASAKAGRVDLPSAEDRLRHLLSYTEDPHQFTAKETERLIAAIDTCKILDPACGSGAFPMGVLHKLVHVLHKLDPQNKQWKERQIEKAAQLDDADIRERTIVDIEDAFEHNALDYGRKLYLIENGIYGVDIQPIAMQIAKLRFFISLVVDQRVDPKRPNLGVRPLPNLETKFVAANTLMKLEREEANLFTNLDIPKKKAQLKRVRHDYFEARTPQRKAKCREQDKQLREELAELLVGEHELQPKTAKMLAGWDPYDQNASAPFFDTEWMFGLNEGFNIVIGNPPYRGGREWKEAEGREYELFSRTYEVAEYQFDMYVLFWEQSIRLTGRDGIVVFITPNTWLNNQGTTKLRKYILANTQVLSILDCTRQTVFESVVVLPIVTVLQRTRSSNGIVSILEPSEEGFETVNKVPSSLWIEDDICIFNTSIRAEDVAVRSKILSRSTPLENSATVKFGVKLYETGKGIPPQKSTAAKERIYESDKKQGKDYRRYLEGKDVDRFKINWEGRWLRYGQNLAAPRYAELFEGPRLLFRRIVGERLIGAFVEEDFVSGQLLQIVKPHDSSMARAILAILNSTAIAYYFVKKYDRQDLTFPEIRIYELASLPIP